MHILKSVGVMSVAKIMGLVYGSILERLAARGWAAPVRTTS